MSRKTRDTLLVVLLGLVVEGGLLCGLLDMVNNYNHEIARVAADGIRTEHLISMPLAVMFYGVCAVFVALISGAALLKIARN